MEHTRSAKLMRALQDMSDRQVDMSEEEGAESGFTLIELMVVLLIMAILLAIAIPTFLGVKSSAQDRSAQSDLTNAIISAKAVFTQGGFYPSGPNGSTGVSMVSQLNSTEPELTFTTIAVTSNGTPHSISVTVSSDGNILVLADQSADGRCWYAEDDEEPSNNSTSTGGLPANQITDLQGVHYAGTTVTEVNCSASAIIASLPWGASYPA